MAANNEARPNSARPNLPERRNNAVLVPADIAQLPFCSAGDPCDHSRCPCSAGILSDMHYFTITDIA